MATEAQSLDDGDLKAGFLALSALHGVESSALTEFTQHEDAVAAESKKRKKEQMVIPPKVWTGGQALELLMVLDAEKGATFLEQAKTVNSWSAKLALSSWAQRTENPSALEFIQQAATFEGVQQTVLSLYQAKLDSENAIEIAKKALETAVVNGDALAGKIAVAQLSESYGQEGKYSQLWTEVSELLNITFRLQMKEGYWGSLEGARVALLTGNFETGLALSKQIIGSAEGAILQEGIWLNAMMSAQVKDSEALKLALEKTDEVNKPWIEAFDNVSTHQQIFDVDALVTSTVSAQQFVTGTLFLAPSCDVCVEKLVPIALEKAILNGDKIRLQLIQEIWFRANGNATESQNILAKLASEYPSAHLGLELNVRNQSHGVDLVVDSALKEESDFEKMWSAIAAEKDLVLDTKDQALKGLSAVSSLVDASGAKSASDNYVDGVWQNTPYHRSGLLSIGTALDGSNGFNHGKYLKELLGQSEDKLVSAGVGLIEMERTIRMGSKKAFTNHSQLKAYSAGEDQNLLLQTAKLKASIVEYWLGGAFPAEDMLALSEEETKLKKSAKPLNLYKKTVLSGNSLREKSTSISVVSYLDWNGTYYVAVVSPATSGVKKVGSVSSVNKLLKSHHEALLDGVNRKTSNHLIGDDLRSVILLPTLVDELMGVGKYLIIAPTEFLGFSLSSMPEQRDGLRFLADIRKIGVGTSLEASWSGIELGYYDIDMLAFNRPEVEAEWNDSTTDFGTQGLPMNQNFSPEIGLAKLHFGDMAKVMIGDEATLENFRTNAPKARYIYLSEIPTSQTGGFEFTGGELSLTEIESLKLQAMTVFISPAAVEIQAARIEAFMRAGVQSVVVQAWALPTKDQSNYVENLFISLKRNDPLMLATEKSRQNTIAGRSKADEYINNAGIWGSFTIFAKP